MTTTITTKNIRLLSLGAYAQMEFAIKPYAFHIILFHPDMAKQGFVRLGIPGVPRSHGFVEVPATTIKVPLARFIHMENRKAWSLYMGYDKASNTLCVAEPDWW